MSNPDINLSTATRTNLLSLTRTTDLIARTQERLSTGLKVNSAIDLVVISLVKKTGFCRGGYAICVKRWCICQVPRIDGLRIGFGPGK